MFGIDVVVLHLENSFVPLSPTSVLFNVLLGTPVDVTLNSTVPRSATCTFSCAARPLGCCLTTAICSRGPGHHYSLPMAAVTPPPHEHHGTGTPSAGYDRVAQTLCALQILRVPHRRQVPCGTDPGPPAVPADGHRSGATGCRQQGALLFNPLHDATRRCCGVSGRLCPGSYRRKGLKEPRGCVWRVGGLVLP